jgi:hypothetical protein
LLPLKLSTLKIIRSASRYSCSSYKYYDSSSTDTLTTMQLKLSPVAIALSLLSRLLGMYGIILVRRV